MAESKAHDSDMVWMSGSYSVRDLLLKRALDTFVPCWNFQWLELLSPDRKCIHRTCIPERSDLHSAPCLFSM